MTTARRLDHQWEEESSIGFPRLSLLSPSLVSAWGGVDQPGTENRRFFVLAEDVAPPPGWRPGGDV